MRYDPRIVDGLTELMRDPASLGIAASVAEVKSAQLREGMQLADDLRTHRGVLLMTKGSVMSAHQIGSCAASRRARGRRSTSSCWPAAAKPAQGAPNAGAAPAWPRAA